MKILVTGAKGFVGKNLCAALKNIKDGKDKTHPGLTIEAVYEYDIDSKPEELDAWCKDCDFVFNLAGVNRPQNQEEFMQGNFGFASTLLDTLKKHGNRCPVMLSSSQQASLTGRFGNSEYGRSKKAGEDLFLDYERDFLTSKNSKDSNISDFSGFRCGLKPRVLVYRFPNLFGKWCRPNYNSAVATFCNAFANDLPYTVNDPSVELELLYIDDLVDEMMACLEGKEHHCEFEGLEVLPKEDGRYCYCPITHKITLGGIVDLLKSFAEQPKTLMIPEIPAGSFAKKLYSTYLSYLPKEKVAFPLKMNVDNRGSFTELVHTLNCGQVSINISKPGITKGQHWHNTKWEFFIVVSGHGLIQERKLGTDEIIEFEVTGDNIQCIHMLPGYTHNIINLSDTENLVTVMYCNEIFNPEKPDTFFEPVK
ncbi:MAG: NAD-dependent epimerase/dehydratase family protein [Bacteroidales bacterium]|nr:NAD-dependent epimerase/dehydratase family protein [Bacteroidales bacterium]